jgi:hypothetical protein
MFTLLIVDGSVFRSSFITRIFLIGPYFLFIWGPRRRWKENIGVYIKELGRESGLD